MSPEELDALRKIYETWNEGLDAIVTHEYFHEDIEMTDFPEMPDGGVVRGIDAVRSVWSERQDIMNVKIEPTELVDAGEGRALVVVEISGGIENSGATIPFEDLHFHAVEMENGRLRRIRIFRDRAQALEALGASG